MNIKLALLTAGLTVALSIPLTAQQPSTNAYGSIAEVRDMNGTIETSTVVAGFEGASMRLWLMTRKAGVVITRDEQGNLQGLDGAKNPIPADRYVIMMDITDTTVLRNIGNASATLLVVSPSDENHLVDFKAANGGFGCAITLAEKGEYRFTVNIYADKVSRMAQFRYSVK